jgi:hypothetical protein
MPFPPLSGKHTFDESVPDNGTLFSAWQVLLTGASMLAHDLLSIDGVTLPKQLKESAATDVQLLPVLHRALRLGCNLLLMPIEDDEVAVAEQRTLATQVIDLVKRLRVGAPEVPVSMDIDSDDPLPDRQQQIKAMSEACRIIAGAAFLSTRVCP